MKPMLKTEAVKWVKEYEYELGRPKISDKTKANLNGRIWILLHLFNLTEEDLE